MENNEEIKVNTAEVNANENKPKKNNNGKTVILIIVAMIVVLVIGIGGGFLLASKGKSNNNNVNQAEQKNVDKQEQTKVSKKIDESKPWVYDAEYCINNENKMAYGFYEGEEYSSKEDLKVPYININSEYAKKANEGIKVIYDKEYNKYGEKSGEQSYASNLEYEWFNTDKILSIAIQCRRGWTNAGFGGEYYIYNINLETLEEATYEEVYKECGFTSLENVKEKAEIALLNEIDKSQGALDGTILKYEKYFMNEKGLNFLIPNGVGNPTPLVVTKDTTRNEVVKTNKSDNQTTSYFEQNKNLNYTSNLKDDINGKVALIKQGEKALQTEIKDGYYAYNAWNETYPEWYYIKEIRDIKSEFCQLSNYRNSALYKCIVTYIDNNGKEQRMELATVVSINGNKFEGNLWGSFFMYTGSTMCTRVFSDVYYEEATEQEKAEIEKMLNLGENNGFVQATYTEENAEGIKLMTVIHAMQAYGETLQDSSWTKEELAEVGVGSEQLHKYKVEKLNEFFKSKLGLSIYEIKNLDTTGFTYSQKYQAYYTNFGDSGHIEVTVTECGRDYYGKIFYVTVKVGEGTRELKVMRTDNGWQFLRNTVK